ncbi:hypothetical protein [Nocardia sp. NPDC024068]|uniref:hypothetical protein n=1 Tax=Nocardia sp. NPDC024068 TaxID=3157197 RepID=UPI0033CDE4C3
MTASPTVDIRTGGSTAPGVDIAGSRWPLYKLEALGAGLLVFLVPVVILGSAQAGVLLGAAAGAVLWTLGWWRAAR